MKRDKGAKGLPLAEIREMMKDGRVHVDLGVVFQPGGGTHYYKDTSNGRSKVMVEVETSSGLDLTCRLATRPVWYIPAPGTVVIVAIPMGEIDHCTSIVGILDSGDADDEIGTGKTLVSSEVDLVLKAPIIKHGVDASQAVVRGDEQKAALNSFLDGLETYIQGIGPIVDPPVPPAPVGPKTVALQAAITLLKAASWLSSKVKTE